MYAGRNVRRCARSFSSETRPSARRDTRRAVPRPTSPLVLPLAVSDPGMGRRCASISSGSPAPRRSSSGDRDDPRTRACRRGASREIAAAVDSPVVRRVGQKTSRGSLGARASTRAQRTCFGRRSPCTAPWAGRPVREGSARCRRRMTEGHPLALSASVGELKPSELMLDSAWPARLTNAESAPNRRRKRSKSLRRTSSPPRTTPRTLGNRRPWSSARSSCRKTVGTEW